jgi:hypothetical protein
MKHAIKTMSTTGTACNSFIWLVNEPQSSDHGSKNLIRANAAAWGHQSRRRSKQRPSVRVKGGRLAPKVQVKVITFVTLPPPLEPADHAISSSK